MARDRLTKYVSSTTVVTSEFMNKVFGGLQGTSEGDILGEEDPLVSGHVHDGEHLDGHAQKVNLVDHVVGQIENQNIADGAVTARNLDPSILGGENFILVDDSNTIENAVQSAINIGVSEDNPVKILIPAGTFTIPNPLPLPSGVTLVGEGDDLTILEPTTPSEPVITDMESDDVTPYFNMSGLSINGGAIGVHLFNDFATNLTSITLKDQSTTSLNIEGAIRTVKLLDSKVINESVDSTSQIKISGGLLDMKNTTMTVTDSNMDNVINSTGGTITSTDAVVDVLGTSTITKVIAG